MWTATKTAGLLVGDLILPDLIRIPPEPHLARQLVLGLPLSLRTQGTRQRVMKYLTFREIIIIAS